MIFHRSNTVVGKTCHTYSLDDGKFYIKVYHRTTFSRNIFPSVRMENQAEYEKRVRDHLYSRDILVPSVFDLIPNHEVTKLVNDRKCLTPGTSDILVILADFPNNYGIRKKKLEGRKFDQFGKYGSGIYASLANAGFKMKDLLQNDNVVRVGERLGFYDFKSFWPINEETHKLLDDLIEEEN